MPFDRMIGTIDQWAGEHNRSDVFAQIGPSDLQPRHVEWSQFLDPPQFTQKIKAADVIVAHAGMGSIISALVHGKPILVMPRRGDLRETRNDHQIATAKRFLEQNRVDVAFDEKSLVEKLNTIDTLSTGTQIEPYASPELLEAIRTFIDPAKDRP